MAGAVCAGEAMTIDEAEQLLATARKLCAREVTTCQRLTPGQVIALAVAWLALNGQGADGA